jgi:C4-dicarboxylate-specific signal transduction histidine kinase
MSGSTRQGLRLPTIAGTGLDSNGLKAIRRAAPFLIGLSTLALIALSATLAYAWAEKRAFMRLDDGVAHQLDLYAAVLEQELGHQADLPGMLDQDDQTVALIDAPDNAALRSGLNRRLTRFVARSGALSASVVDAQARTLASSNWYRADTHGDRKTPPEPCIVEGLGSGQPVQRFSPNLDTGAPEVCFARPVRRNGSTVGVVIVRISLQPVEATWVDSAFRAESEKPLIVDSRGIVILSSVPAWKQQALSALTKARSQAGTDAELVRVPALKASGMEMQVVHERPLPRLGWRLMILTNAKDVWREARTAAWTAGAISASLGLLLLLLLQRRRVAAQKVAGRAALQRAHDELETKVLQRTAQLEASNTSLRHEVLERQHAEQVLRQAQEELVQAGRLAMLGQLSAGISHELGQPLTALRALAQNGCLLLDRERPLQARDNFKAILGLAERMGRITSQLKSAARKAPPEVRSLPILGAIDNARQILAARISAESVALVTEVPLGLAARCDNFRLEQVLVNLMANAMDAMRATETRRLTIAAAASDDRAVVRVSDSGPGIPLEINEHLFEPFFTTKAPGEGLGLGLVISSQIVREFGGTLRAVPSTSGAVFEFDVALG